MPFPTSFTAVEQIQLNILFFTTLHSPGRRDKQPQQLVEAFQSKIALLLTLLCYHFFKAHSGRKKELKMEGSQSERGKIEHNTLRKLYLTNYLSLITKDIKNSSQTERDMRLCTVRKLQLQI